MFLYNCSLKKCILDKPVLLRKPLLVVICPFVCYFIVSQVSYYLAEFWNTVSNLSMIIPAVYGIIVTRREGLETRSEQILDFLVS